ncbi:MAG: hypothetical protein U0324_05665 [Polyangiales bacterium]
MLRALVLCALPLLACAAHTAPPPNATPNAPPGVAPPPTVAARPDLAAPPRRRPHDPPHTRRVGGREWSVAVGEDWARDPARGGTRFSLTEGDAAVTLLVDRFVRPRGPADEALDEVVDELREGLARRGIVGGPPRPATIDGAPGRAVSFSGLHAGLAVRALVRAEVRGPRFGVVACVLPASPRADEACSAVVESLALDAEPPAPPGGASRVTQGAASALVPDAWVDVTSEETMRELHSDLGPAAARVTVEGGEGDEGAASLFDDVDTYYARRNAAVVRRVRSRVPGGRRLDFEATFTEPPGVAVTSHFALRGRYVYYLACSEPAGESALRGRCAPVLASFRFDAP